MMIRNILLLTTGILAAACSSPAVKISVSNPTAIERQFETVEISMNDITDKLPEASTQNIVVESSEGDQLPSQVTADGKLIFQTTLTPNGSETFQIRIGERENYTPQTYARLVPERKDDWAWENNRIAFRMYGPALQATGEVSNGIDVWLKRTPELIINKWYTKGVDYHTDHGEGLDCYKVGRTLGAGAMAPVDADTLCLGANFVTAELVDSGAVRTTFRLNYAPFTVGNKQINEQRIISLDANSSFNRITEIYNKELQAVAGITLREAGEVKSYQQGVAYSEPENGTNGTTHLAVVMLQPTEIDTIKNHITASAKGNHINYLSGAGWSKSGYPTAEDWQRAVELEIIKLNNPLKITIQ